MTYGMDTVLNELLPNILIFCKPRDMFMFRYVNKKFKDEIEKYYIWALQNNRIESPYIIVDIMCGKYNIERKMYFKNIHNGKIKFESSKIITLNDLYIESCLNVYISHFSHYLEKDVKVACPFYKYKKIVRDIREDDSIIDIECADCLGQEEMEYSEYPSEQLLYRYRTYYARVFDIHGIVLDISKLTNMFIYRNYEL